MSLHLLQISLVYVNTLMIQQVLGENRWANAMTPDDRRLAHIGVVLAVKEGGLGKDVEDSPHALELEPVQPQLAGIRRLRRSPLVSHDGLRSGRS